MIDKIDVSFANKPLASEILHLAQKINQGHLTHYYWHTYSQTPFSEWPCSHIYIQIHKYKHKYTNTITQIGSGTGILSLHPLSDRAHISYPINGFPHQVNVKDGKTFIPLDI